MRRGMALTTGLGLVLLNLAVVPGTGAAEKSREGAAAIASGLVKREPGRFGVTGADVRDLAVTDAYTSQHTGVTHVYLQQRLRGLPVLGSSATVNVLRGGRILFVGSRLVRGLDGARGVLRIGAGRATITAARALESVSWQQARPAKLVYQALDDGGVRLAWSVEIRSHEHWWIASVDATTGALLTSYDQVDHDTAQGIAGGIARASASSSEPIVTPQQAPDGSSYRVYALPLESPNDGDRTLVENPADAIASPFGWHDTDGAAGPEFTQTRGNNAHAYIDTASTGSAGVPLPGTDAEGTAGLDFDYPLPLQAPPTAYFPAAVTNLFYWSNIIHDVFYRYGFDEASGNFQVNNYGRGGLGNDYLQAEGQDGSGVNNANFATPVDGSRPRMQMYLWQPTTTGDPNLGIIRDGDLESGIITHEYGHGISNRLTGGPNTGGCLSHQEREGEGWSDWLALALTTRAGENGVTPRGMGPYVLGQPNRQGAGIRPTRYSTNMAVNGTTYDDIKTLAVPHGVGYAWATMLWEVYWDLIAKHGFNPNAYGPSTSGGNNLAIQLVLDGMKLQPCSPGFVDARNAILAADVALTGGENRCLIWRGFAKRGLGYSANQGLPTSRSDGKEAFDTRPDCRPRATSTPESLQVTVPPGGQATATLAIGNAALADGQSLSWTVLEAATTCTTTSDLAWLSASPATGATAAADSAEVSVTIDGSGGPQDGLLCIVSNDATTPRLAVPVSVSIG